jgi:hypothetical protein
MLGGRARGDAALMHVLERGERMARQTVLIVVTATS